MKRATETYRTAFDAMIAEMPDELAESAYSYAGDWDGKPYQPPARQQPGVYAWGEAHLQKALVVQFEATGDPEYLEIFTRRFLALLALRDDRAGRVDLLRGRVIPAWGSERFSGGRSTCFLVHAGYIAFPAARFLRLIRQSTALQQRFAEAAEIILPALQQTIAAYAPDWREGPDPQEGYYYEPAMPDDGHLPLNQQNALGATMLELSCIPGCEGYLERVERLARFLKRRMWRDEDGACQWAYRPPLTPPFDASGIEDTSHAVGNADFAWRCRQEGIIFTVDDLASIARAFTQRICPEHAGEVADEISGATRTGLYRNVLPYWAPLATVDPTIATRIVQALTGHGAFPTGPMGLYALAVFGWLQSQGLLPQ